MGLFIEKEDFVGKFLVAKGNYDLLDNYIDRYEVPYLKQLLGATLYELFIADYGLPSQDPIYGVLIDAFDEDDEDEIVSSKGIADMLLGFIYFEYMREQNIKPTNTGLVIGQSENSGAAKVDDNYIYDRYNSSIETYCAIQWYINEHDEDYPDYNGQQKRISHWSL